MRNNCSFELAAFAIFMQSYVLKRLSELNKSPDYVLHKPVYTSFMPSEVGYYAVHSF